MLSKDEFKAKWSSLHSDAETTGIVGAWLNISYRFGLICTLLRISPNALTYLGLLSAVRANMDERHSKNGLRPIFRLSNLFDEVKFTQCF